MMQTQTEALLVLISKLPEIDFVDVLKGMAEQIRRNKWEYIIDGCFDIDTHEEELECAGRELEKLEDEKDNLLYAINDISTNLASGLEAEGEEALRETIKDAIDKLNAVS